MKEKNQGVKKAWYIELFEKVQNFFTGAKSVAQEVEEPKASTTSNIGNKKKEAKTFAQSLKKLWAWAKVVNIFSSKKTAPKAADDVIDAMTVKADIVRKDIANEDIRLSVNIDSADTISARGSQRIIQESPQRPKSAQLSQDVLQEAQTLGDQVKLGASKSKAGRLSVPTNNKNRLSGRSFD
jgi:hypothetical protein